MGYETLIRRAHVMTRKNTLKSLPTDTEFRVVGLDLAKSWTGALKLRTTSMTKIT